MILALDDLIFHQFGTVWAFIHLGQLAWAFQWVSFILNFGLTYFIWAALFCGPFFGLQLIMVESDKKVVNEITVTPSSKITD